MVVGGKLHQGKKPIIGEGGGSLGGLYDPFRLEYDPATGTRIPALQLPADLTPERLGDRQQLLRAFDRPATAPRSCATARATRRLPRPGVRHADLAGGAAGVRPGRETASVQDRYGRTRFGQSCLLARRLVEQGVPFVQVNWSDHVEAEEDAGDGGWDHHYRNFQIMQDRHAPWLDQALSALLDDLRERGLLRYDAGGGGGRVRPVAEDQRQGRPRPLGALLQRPARRRRRPRRPGDRRQRRPAEHGRTTSPLTPADVAATVHHAVGITSEQAATLGLA